jgi:pimeloyl-ACP methyl ester carboxylesterase
MDNENQTIRLADGRTLGFAKYGPQSGSPVFYFTGGNSSRLEGRWFEIAAQKHKVNLIVPDRPGFGLSDFQPSRKFLDWPKDVAALAESLGIDKFSVFGLSGGAPHVAAVAYQLSERLFSTAMVSGVAPPEMPNRFAGMWPPIRLIFLFARRFPKINRLVLRQMGSFYADKEQMLKRMKQALPEPDVRLIDSRPAIIEIFSSAAMEAHRKGVDGDAWEWGLYVQPWGFNITDIKVEMGLWYGEYDRNVPVGMGQYYARQFPKNQLHIVLDGGHFSTINNHIDSIFSYLLKRSGSGKPA